MCVGQVANLVPGFQIDFDVIQFVISIVSRSDCLKDKFIIVPVQSITDILGQPKNWTWKDAFEHIDQLVFCTGEKNKDRNTTKKHSLLDKTLLLIDHNVNKDDEQFNHFFAMF